MADPKYAHLPGIASDEPDVYETNDLPESEQVTNFYEEENDPIERIHLSANEAFNKFKGKYLNQREIDFSDRISKALRTGYDATSGDWEFVAKGEAETPLQKYQRLQCELKELLESVESLQKNKNDKVDCLITTDQVQETLRRLGDLRLEESLGTEVVSSITDPNGVHIKKLLSQLEVFKSNILDKPESQRDTDESGITYQFNYKPDQAKLVQTARVAELESRIHQLESVLGASAPKLERLAAGTSKGTLLESAQHLACIANLLNSSQLDHIEGRLAGLLQKLEAISEKKKQLAQDEEKDAMILELYEVVKNSENVYKLLPQTIERLKSLEGLHNRAADLTKTLAQIENIQSEIQGNVENNKVLLQGVQESFAINLNEINQTVMNLDTRIKCLKKK